MENGKPRNEDFKAMDERVCRLEEIISDNGIEELKDAIEELTILVKGDERLNVLPLRVMVGEIYVAYARGRWLAGVLGITTLSGIVAVVILILKLIE